MRHVLIAGCGYVGTALGLRLAARGDQVYGLRRQAQGLPSPLLPITADLAVPADLSRVPSRLTHIVYAASAGGSSDELYRKAYVDGLRNVLQLPQVRSPLFRQLLLVSSTAVYEQSDGAWVDERSKTSATSFSAARLLEGEQLLFRSGVSHTILRCAGIYGPGRDRLIRLVQEGKATFNPEQPAFTNRIHRDDVAGALIHLMDRAEPSALYVGVDHDPAPLSEVVTWLAAALNWPTPKPEAAAPVAPRDSRDSGANGVLRSGRGGNKRCSNAKLLSAGYRFLYPTFREGYADNLRRSPSAPR